jgi:hypothetical protein
MMYFGKDQIPDLFLTLQGLAKKMIALRVRLCWRGSVPAHFPVIRYT